MTIEVHALNAEEVANAQAQADRIRVVAMPPAAPDRFVYFAAFDGTSNDRAALWKAGTTISTNVAALEEQVALANQERGSVAHNYFAGPGTDGWVDSSAAFPTPKIIETAESAYLDFSREASKWAEHNPLGKVTAAFAAFSRGSAAAAVFSQLLYERGLIHPDTGEVLIPPGQVGISSGVAFDPVMTGVAMNVAFAPNVRNVVVVRALNEYRDLFGPVDYADHPGITTVFMTGNHTDIGGGYDNGIGALTLAAATEMFRRSGINIADVLPARQFDPGQAVIHDEAFDRVLNFDTGEWETRRTWSSYGSVAEGTVRRIDTDRTILNESTAFNPDGSIVSTFTNYRGQSVVTTRTTNADGSRSVHTQLKYPDGQVATETRVHTSLDGNTVTIASPDGAGGWRESRTVRTPHEDGSYLLTIHRADGSLIAAAYDTDSRLSAHDLTSFAPSGVEITIRSEPVNGVLVERYRTTTSIDDEGSRTVLRQHADGHRETTVFNGDGSLFNREWTTPLGTQSVSYGPGGTPVRTVVTQGDDDGNTLVITTHADGSGTALALDSTGTLVSESSFQRTDAAGLAAIDGENLRINSTASGRALILDAHVGESATGGDFAAAVEVVGIEAIDGVRVGDSGLTQADLATFGLTFSDLARGNLPASVNALIGGVDPTAVMGAGWAPPTVLEQPLPHGFERRIELPNGFTLTSTYDSDRRLMSVAESYSPNSFETQTSTYQVNADGSRVLASQTSLLFRSDGSYIGTRTDVAARQVYRVSGDVDGNTTQEFDRNATENLRALQSATVFSDVNSLVSAIRGGQAIPVLVSGARLLNSIDGASGAPTGNFGAAAQVGAGVLSFYNLYNALENGDAFSKLNSALSAVSYANLAINGTFSSAGQLVGFAGEGAGAVNTVLNGGPGTVGVLAVVGLIASIRAKDPIGVAMSAGVMWQGATFMTTPVGWALVAASVLRAVFEKGSPDAWGVSKVTFGEGLNNLAPVVRADGENFGPDRVRQQLQSVVDVVTQIIAGQNQAQPDSAQWLGLIPQRMPGLSFRAAEFQDKGYAVSDIDPLSGAQRIPFLRFDDQGDPFGFVPEDLSAQERAMLSLPGTQAPALVAYMLNSALQRGAIAPLWEVRTAKLQEQAGDPNAGLMEEERAAKTGLAAPLDTAYAAAHAADPQAQDRRVGRFTVIGLDLNGDGTIGTRTLAQTAAAGRAITFDWDGQQYQKRTGWVGAEDGFLVLDHDFNQSVDTAKEMFSNPLVADAAKGLRLLAAYDANRDGRIDALDPVYTAPQIVLDARQANPRSLEVGRSQWPI